MPKFPKFSGALRFARAPSSLRSQQRLRRCSLKSAGVSLISYSGTARPAHIYSEFLARNMLNFPGGTRNVKEGESKFAAPKIVLFCAKGQTALLRIAGQYYRAYNFHAVPKSSDSRTTSANDLQLRFDSTLQPSANAFPLKPDVYSHKIAGLSAFPDGHVVDIVAIPHFLHMEGPSPVMVAAKMLTGTSETVWVSCISLATLVNISCFWLC